MRALSRIVAGWVVVGLSVVGASRAGTTPQYMVEYLGPAVHIDGMNESGEIVGWTTVLGNVRGYIAGPDHPYQLLPLPEGYISSWARDINDSGVVVGSVGESFTPEFGEAVTWTPDGSGGYDIEFLGALPQHTQSIATAINNRGDIVGYSIQPGFQGGPSVWFNAPDGVMNISTLGAPGTPSAINDEGQLTGATATSGSVVFDLDTMEATTLALPRGWLFPTSYGINNLGEVAGYVVTSSSVKFCTRWTIEQGWQQLSLAVNSSAQVSSWDINDDGTVIMSVPGVRAYFEGIGSVSLGELLAEPFTNWVFVNNLGGAVNNKGEFGVIAVNTDNQAESGLAIVRPILPACPGDLDGDRFVGSADLNLVLGSFGIDDGGDLNGDGVTDSLDLNIVLGAFGDGC